MSGEIDSQFSWRRTTRDLAVQGIILLVLMAVLYPGVFLRGEYTSSADLLYLVPPWSEYAPEGFDRPNNTIMVDIIAAFRPYYSVTRESIDEGVWPLWNPYQYTGVPNMANCQSAVFYPPRLLHAFLPLDLATTIFFVMKLWICGMTAFICGRGLGLALWPSRFLSIAWALCGYNVIWCYWPLTDVAAWLPIVFLGVEFALRGQYQRGFFTLATGGALLLYAGHPETAFTMGLGVGEYFVLRLLLDGRDWSRIWKPTVVAIGGWVLALLLVMPMVLPFLEYLANSSTFFIRHEGADEEPPLGGYAIAQFFIPRFFGTHAEGTYWGDLDTNRHFMLYSGIAVWIAMIPAMIGMRTDRAHRAKIMALLIPAGLGILLGFGVYPVGLLNNFPPLNALIPSYNICFTIFAIPLVGAIGLDRAGRMPIERRHLMGLVGLALIAVIAVGFPQYMLSAIINLSKQSDAHTQYIATALFFFLLGGTVLLLHRGRKMGALGSAFLCAFLVADLLIASWRINPTLPRDQVYPETELFSVLREVAPGGRLGVAEAGLPSGIMTTFLFEELYGYDGLYPGRIIQYSEGLGPDVWNAMMPVYGISHFLKDTMAPDYFPEDHAENWQVVGAANGIEIWEYSETFDRAFIVPNAEVVSDKDVMLARMADEEFDPAALALVESELPQPLSGGTGKATIVSRGIDRVVIEAAASGGAGLLVLSDAYYPGWRATIDGVPTEIVPAYYAFRGVVIPEGTHEVIMEYRPKSFTLGLALSYFAMISSVAYGVLSIRRKRN